MSAQPSSDSPPTPASLVAGNRPGEKSRSWRGRGKGERGRGGEARPGGKGAGR